MTATTTAADVAEAVAGVLTGVRAVWHNEDQLQAVLTAALTAAGCDAVREVRLSRADRVDILATTPGGARIGVEVKIAGDLLDVVRQLQRYAHSPDIDALVLATTRHLHREVPAELAGMPVRVAVITGGAW